MGQHDKEWGELITPLADQKEEWWVAVMDVGLDPELTKWSVCLGPAIVLTGKGYKEYHWLVIPHQPLQLFPTSPTLHMPSDRCATSSHILPSSVNQLGIGHATIRICGQAGSHTNQGCAITPFMYNEEECQGVTPSKSKGGLPAPEARVRASVTFRF